MEISTKTVAEIKNMLETVAETQRFELLSLMDNDSRVQVRKLANSKRYALKKEQNELAFSEGLLRYERKLYEQGFNLVAGVDEAGRGALAGPLVAAAAILPQNLLIRGLRDSKQLTPEKRDTFYDIIIDKAFAWSTVRIEHDEIDINGIQWANLKALEQAVLALKPTADYVLSDAFTLPNIQMPSLAVIKGDAKSLSIAAASVIAKVSRDRIMMKYHEVYPEYEFDKHKGYGTATHINLIEQHGVTPIHRTSFAPCSEIKQLYLDVFGANDRPSKQPNGYSNETIQRL